MTVTIAKVSGMTFVSATSLDDTNTATSTTDTTGGDVTWTTAFDIPNVNSTNVTKRLIVQGTAATTTADKQIVWKDLSTTASLVVGGNPAVTEATHGPKVIPPDGRFDTARYGDRPFPVVPVDYSDRTHDTAKHPGSALANVINDPNTPGSTFNLYQEMSLGQLFPQADVPRRRRVPRVDGRHEAEPAGRGDGRPGLVTERVAAMARTRGSSPR